MERLFGSAGRSAGYWHQVPDCALVRSTVWKRPSLRHLDGQPGGLRAMRISPALNTPTLTTSHSKRPSIPGSNFTWGFPLSPDALTLAGARCMGAR